MWISLHMYIHICVHGFCKAVGVRLRVRYAIIHVEENGENMGKANCTRIKLLFYEG